MIGSATGRIAAGIFSSLTSATTNEFLTSDGVVLVDWRGRPPPADHTAVTGWRCSI
jgi:hypothetical protein